MTALEQRNERLADSCASAIDRTPVYCFGVRKGCSFYSRDGIAEFRFYNDSNQTLRVTVELLGETQSTGWSKYV